MRGSRGSDGSRRRRFRAGVRRGVRAPLLLGALVFMGAFSAAPVTPAINVAGLPLGGPEGACALGLWCLAKYATVEIDMDLDNGLEIDVEICDLEGVVLSPQPDGGLKVSCDYGDCGVVPY